MTKICLIGANGATGRLVLDQLLNKPDCTVIAIVRRAESLAETIHESERVHIISDSIAEVEPEKLASYIQDCDVIISCLGHNLSFKGIWGKPRRLVTQTVKNLVLALRQSRSDKCTKFILMNTVGNANRSILKPPLSQRLVVFLLRYLVPPHADNEQAAEILRTLQGDEAGLFSWVAVRLMPYR